jgi:MFS family permease
MQHRQHQAHFWHFLKNKEMNEIYLAYGIDNFAMGLVSIFVPIYLYKIGYPIIGVLFYYFLLPVNSVLLASLIAKTVAKVGVKYSMLVSAIFKICFLITLRLLPTHAWLFAILPTFNVLKTQFSSLSYHLNFVEHSDAKHRGRQVGAFQASALFASISAPLIGGLVIAGFGFKILFIVASILIVCSVIPIFLLKRAHNVIEFNPRGIWQDLFRAENKPFFMSYGGYAVEEWIGFAVWSLFIFLMVEKAEVFGALNTIVAAVTFVVFYAVGKLSDTTDKRHIIKVSNIMYFFGWIARLFANSFVSVIFIDSYKNITGNILQVPWMAYSYDLASKRDYFRFIVQREIMYDFSRVLFVPLVLLIFAVDIQPFLLSFVMAAFFSLGYMAINQTEVAVKK